MFVSDRYERECVYSGFKLLNHHSTNYSKADSKLSFRVNTGIKLIVIHPKKKRTGDFDKGS